MDDPATTKSFETAYGGDSMLATLACAASEDTNFPQSNESASSILSNTRRLSEEVLAQLNQNTWSISSCISRAQLLLGQLTDTANSQLESGATNGVHHMTEVGQKQLTPHQDDEISFELSQDSDGEGVTSPFHEDSRVRSIGPIDEPEPLSQLPEFAPVANAKWEIRETTEVRPPRPASTVPHDQLSTGFAFEAAVLPTDVMERISSTAEPHPPKANIQTETPKPMRYPPSSKAKTHFEGSNDLGSRLEGTCAERRATPLKANASRAKLWAAGGISRATVETVVSGVGARSRSSVGAASWTSASSALSRASIGSKTRDSSVEPLPGDRVVGAPPCGRSRNSRPLAQQARGPKASGETPAVFPRLWEGTMERQRARSREAPAVSGAARLIVPRHSLGSSTGSNNSSSAQRRSISEKDTKSTASTPPQAPVPPPGQGGIWGTEGGCRDAHHKPTRPQNSNGDGTFRKEN
ncbi:hypothetical protein TGVAND_249425 [Toxoplasma gondii VAND]|uniref:Uncharacterized protein n=2 Tax=Toxoplasma gondii TaxID=5811 RepID=A0A086QHA8_TOXGO|nr:hypothetical protein TGVAND_249425 [Toxoplasma gondii VAND]